LEVYDYEEQHHEKDPERLDCLRRNADAC